MADQLRMDAVVSDKATGPLRKIREELAAFRETDGMKSLKENMKGLREHTAEFSKAAAGASTVMGGIGIVGVAASLSVGKLIDAFRDLAQRTTEMRALSKETGLTMEAINALGHTAPQFGVSAETMTKGLTTLADHMQDVRRHTGDLYAELSRQAPDFAKKLLGDNPEQQVQDILKFLDGIQNPQIRKRWAEAFFGDGDIARLVQDGYKTFADEQKRQSDALPKFTGDYLQQVKEYNSAIGAFNDSLEKLELKVAPAVFTELKQAADDFRAAFEWVEKAWDWAKNAKEHPGEAAKEVAGAAADAVRDKANQIGEHWSKASREVQSEDGNALRRNDEMPLPTKKAGGILGLFGGSVEKSAYTAWDDDRRSGVMAASYAGGGSSQAGDLLQKAVRAGVVQGLQDFSDLKRAESGAGGGGFQNASWGGGGLEGGLGGAHGGHGGGGDFDASGFGGKAPKRGSWWTPERQAHAVDRLMKEAGLSEPGAEGLVSRWANVEAGAGPTALNPHSGAAGIGQWLGSRKHGFTADYDSQITHAVGELNGPEKRAAAALRAAKDARGGAMGAAMFERAEGYNGRSDNWAGKSYAGAARVHAEVMEARAAARRAAEKAGQDGGTAARLGHAQTKAEQSVVKHTGGAQIEIKGLPRGTSIHSKTDGLIDSVKLNRSSTQPDLIWGEA